MEERNNFGKFIQTKRKEAGLTQHELADRLFITESAISKWERGLSYPDITLILPICRELNLSEHELITSSEDHTIRIVEKQAKNYKTIHFVYNAVFIGMYLCAIIACFICNLAIDHTLSWFFVVLTGVMTGASLTTVPTMVKKSKAIITFTSFLVSLILLLITCAILYQGGAWIFITLVSVIFGMAIIFLPLILRYIPARNVLSRHKAALSMFIDTLLLYATVFVCISYDKNLVDMIPNLAVLISFEITLPWFYLVIIRYTHMNGLLKAGVCSLATTVYTVAQNRILSYLLKYEYADNPVNFANWDANHVTGNVNLIIYLSFLFVSLVLLVAGIIRQATIRK